MKPLILLMSLSIFAFFILVGFIRSISQNEPPAVVTPALTSTTTTAASTTFPSKPNPPVVTRPTTPVTITPSGLAGIGHAVGISAGGSLSRMSLSDMNAYLDQMSALGVTWVRFDVEWGIVQYNSPNNFDWSNFDDLVSAINSHHMNGLGIILFTPAWARNPSCTGGAKCPPNDPQQFATFAASLANRYKDKGIHDWEIWNEPNNYDFWATKTDCVAYTNLLKVTYPAIKAVDPLAVIVSGGLAPENTDNHNISQMDFLRCIYANGGKEYFDVFGDHSYTFPSLPSDNKTNIWAQMSVTSPSLRSIMIANGDGAKKTWITEFGVPTNGPNSNWYVSEARQAQMVVSSMNLYKTYDWAGPIFWYTLRDNGTSTNTNENFFGLIRADGSLKPAYTTLKDILSHGI
ncbi:MAG: beta-xylosidase [Candidatus Parcubacteria bacterium]|nr:beta-xylosidase [Candidatus Parcubacteria bacterium]